MKSSHVVVVFFLFVFLYFSQLHLAEFHIKFQSRFAEQKNKTKKLTTTKQKKKRKACFFLKSKFDCTCELSSS